MARKIDHARRKREIAEKATTLFSQVGYDNVSLIMVAAAAGVSRTALYRYYCSKRELLDDAIRAAADDLAGRCGAILRERASAVERLERICHAVVEVMFSRKSFIIAIFDFVLAMVRTGADMNARIDEYTAGTRNALRRLVEHGKRRGEFASVLIPERATDILYGEFESCAMRIVLGTERDAAAAKLRLSDTIRAIADWR